MDFPSEKKEIVARCHKCGIGLTEQDKRIKLSDPTDPPRLITILCMPCAKPVLEIFHEEKHKRDGLPPPRKAPIKMQ
jgi:hypothetical protein